MEEPLPVSKLVTALFCKRKLYLEKLLQKKENVHQVILAEALRYTNRSEPGIVKSIKEYEPKDVIQDLYYDNARRSLQEALLNNLDTLRKQEKSIIGTNKKVWEQLKPYIKARIENTHEFVHKNKLYGNELWTELLPKITYNLVLSSKKIGLSIIIDRVDNYPNQAIPLLYKKQKAPEKGMWYNHKYELAAAMLLLAEQGLVIQEGILGYDNGRQERTIELTPELKKQLEEEKKETKKILQEKNLPGKTENKNKCELCNYKEKCYDDVYIVQKQQEYTKSYSY